jgi:hypothetical protein
MEPFSVRMEARAPEGDCSVTADEAADELMDLLEDYDGIVSAGPRSWDARVTIMADSARQAAEEGAQLIESQAVNAGMPQWPAACVEAVRRDMVSEQLARPLLPALVSAPEAADILGVSLQRVHQIARAQTGFPAPVYELQTGKLWLRTAIEAFAERKRQPGRPRKAAVAAG